ncbi:MAG: FtsX-like permease family protein [Cyanobacteria bacterium SZAS LIN-2]|nr:FtsX-like permease family protein [Cyanobacteria bacterium SZAS LIN-2]
MQFVLSLFYRFVIRDMRVNWVRTLLTICGIALGVSVFLAISIANDTALTRFSETVGRISGKANIEIMSLSGTGVDQDILRDLSALGAIGVKDTPIIDENVVFVGKPVDQTVAPEAPGVAGSAGVATNRGDREMVQLIGIDMLADPDFKSYQEDADEADKKSKSAVDLSVFTPRAVLAGSKLAARYGLHEGSTFQVLVSDHMESLKVAGILSSQGLGGAYSGNLLVADIGLAQDILHWPGRVSRIDLIAPEDMIAPLQEKIRTLVPADVLVTTPDTRSEQAHKMTRSFEYNLLALTLIALMVGMFLIYNTMTITVLRRRPEIGILRALGVSRTIILRMFLLEALALGGLGTLLGLVLGAVMADGALKAVAQTFQYFYFKVPLDKVTVDPRQYLLAFLIGMGLTLAAAFPPLLEASSVAPAEATRRASHESKVRSTKLIMFILGLSALLIAYITALQPPVYGFPAFGYAAALFSIIGASLLTPYTLGLVLPALAQPMASLFGAEGRIAARSLKGTLGRTAVASASLMIGIAMMVALAIMISSFRQTVTAWIDQSFQADLWLQSQARSAGNKEGRLPESVVAKVAAVKGVAAAEGFVDRRIMYEGMSAFLGAADLDVLARYGNQLFVSGRSSKEVCAKVVGMHCMVSEPFAVRRGVKAGDSIALDTPRGKTSFFVDDVFYDYASDLGYVIIPRDTYKNLFGDDTVSNVAIYLDKGADLDKVRSDVLAAVSSNSLLTLSSTAELRKQAIIIFDRTFAITYALHTIAVTVAILSVMNALFALTLESKREFAILRYIGASRGQLSRVVYLQAALIGVFGNVGGIGLGYILSLLLVHVINKQSFGWSVQYSVPFDFIAQSTILVIVTAVLSAVVPAKMAARTLAPAAVRDE